MNIHEYQAREILEKFGLPVPNARVATTSAEAKAIAQELGGKVVVKAQVHAGGRGKAGGVKLASTPEEAETYAAGMLGTMLETASPRTVLSTPPCTPHE